MPFKCDYCPSKFAHKTAKYKHMRVVCQNRPGRSISSQINLAGNEPAVLTSVTINNVNKISAIKLKNASSEVSPEEKIIEPMSVKSTDNSDQSNLSDIIKKLSERMDRIELKILTERMDRIELKILTERMDRIESKILTERMDRIESKISTEEKQKL
jgi:hypothetical protein